MNTQELTIGSLITQGKVVSIFPDRVFVEELVVRIMAEDIEPIIVTPKILENNGFKFEYFPNDTFFSHICGVRIEMDMTIRISPLVEIDVSEVHKLQRALIDLGYEELANNFII